MPNHLIGIPNFQMKKTKLNYDAAIKQIDMMMPDDMKEPNKKALTMCKDSINGVKDPCEVEFLRHF